MSQAQQVIDITCAILGCLAVAAPLALPTVVALNAVNVEASRETITILDTGGVYITIVSGFALFFGNLQTMAVIALQPRVSCLEAVAWMCAFAIPQAYSVRAWIRDDYKRSLCAALLCSLAYFLMLQYVCRSRKEILNRNNPVEITPSVKRLDEFIRLSIKHSVYALIFFATTSFAARYWRAQLL